MPCPDLGDLRDWYEDTREHIEDAAEDVRDELQSRLDSAVANFNDYCDRINVLQDKKALLEAYHNFLVDYEESLDSIQLALESAPYQETYSDGIRYEEITSDISTNDDPDYLYSKATTYIQSVSALKEAVSDDIDELWLEIFNLQGYRDAVQSTIDSLRSQLGI